MLPMLDFIVTLPEPKPLLLVPNATTTDITLTLVLRSLCKVSSSTPLVASIWLCWVGKET
jgi:hypothetical protein